MLTFTRIIIKERHCHAVRNSHWEMMRSSFHPSFHCSSSDQKQMVFAEKRRSVLRVKCVKLFGLAGRRGANWVIYSKFSVFINQCLRILGSHLIGSRWDPETI